MSGRKATMMRIRMKNRRYRKTEEAILEVFFKESTRGVTMVKMAKKAGICRATMYVHHRAIREILPDYENYILAEYQLILKRRLKSKSNSPKNFYFDMLTFILKRRKIFKMFLRLGDREIVMRMLEILRLKTAATTRLSRGTEKTIRIYESEVVEVIFGWGKGGFKEDELEKVLSDILYLTKTAKDRLMPIE